MSKRRVVISGLGILSPLGNDLASSWQGIVDGRSASADQLRRLGLRNSHAGSRGSTDALIAPKESRDGPVVNYGVAAR